MMGRGMWAVLAAVVAVGVAVAPRPASAMLSTPGFRAVGVAHSAYPISSLALAPDGRLFATVQALGQTIGTTPGTAEIRVYSTYSTGDGSTLDEGTVWATVDNVRATTTDEGLLGIALAPDFATSKLVYVYLTTTDESVNQHVRVYRENTEGVGVYLGTVATSLEPPTEQTARSGGPVVFGVDGCLFVGVGDNGSSNRWDAQLLIGTDPIQGAESSALCTDVCLGPDLYPARTIPNDGALNQAGKVLRLDVEGASTAQAGPEPPIAAQPFVFGAGLRNPIGLAVHPLTGQLYANDKSDGQTPEVDVVDEGSNLGWPCLEGGLVASSGAAACLVGHTPDEVYAQHPDWRRPLVTPTGNPAVSGVGVYTGLGYPAEYYGDVFYLLRDGARIYRIDLDPPCFLPHPNGVTAIPFHDSNDNGDFTVFYDINGDGQFDQVSLTTLVAIVQAPNPLGQQVLYVAGKQGNSSALNEDSVIFRIEYATEFTPYTGPAGRVPDSCFTDGVYSGGGTGVPPYAYENPFLRAQCLPPGGPCPGQPDGTSCDDGDACNGEETCQGGICRHSGRAADGTACDTSDPCRAQGSCQNGACVLGALVPDGTACPSADACDGLRVCQAGVCEASGGPTSLDVHALKLKRDVRGTTSGVFNLAAAFHPPAPIKPDDTDSLVLELRDGTQVLFSADLDHPSSDPFWRRPKPGLIRYADPSGSAGGLTAASLRIRKSGSVEVALHARHLGVSALDGQSINPRLWIGSQCFAADLSGRCSLDARKLRCGR